MNNINESNRNTTNKDIEVNVNKLNINNKASNLLKEQVAQWGTREARLLRRNEKNKNETIRNETNISYTAEDMCKCYEEAVRNEAYYVDWNNHTDDSIYYSYSTHAYIRISTNNIDSLPQDYVIEEGFRVVTEGVPKSFTKALHDPVWGDPARTEMNTLKHHTHSIVEANPEVAKQDIENGAELLRFIAIYEEKIKDGVLVRKVRLVLDGRYHTQHGATYSSTPSKEENLILLHIFAHYDWDYFVMDEERAFLNAPRTDLRPLYCKIPGDPTYYNVKNAVYGQKDACHDHRIKKDKQYVNELGCRKSQVWGNLYEKRDGDKVILSGSHVDDFMTGGNDVTYTSQFIAEARKLAKYTDPVLNGTSFLGLELERLRDKRLILVRVTKQIDDLVNKFSMGHRNCNVPMPTNGYVIRECDYARLKEESKRALTVNEIKLYMSGVGCLVWIESIRLDIVFAVLYLTWHTKAPLVHHMNMLHYVIGYLHTTRNLPLVLGGTSETEIHVTHDCSLGTGPKGRSITGITAKLNKDSGAVTAKAYAQNNTALSSFEGELDGVTDNFKKGTMIANLLDDISIHRQSQIKSWNDNLPVINFVKGNGVVKGVRHMERRMWYTREQFSKGTIAFGYVGTNENTSDKLTKLGTVNDHRNFVTDIMGLLLLGYNYYDI